MAFDKKLYNVVMLGVCFMLIFTAFQTSSNVQTDVLNQVVRDGEHTLKGKGYTSLSIIYAVFAVTNFLAPPLVSLCGPKISMMIGGVCYCLFIGNLIYPLVPTLFVASVIVGFGAAVIWTAQGNFLTINSNDETMGRNSGIFWALLQCSLLFGNMFVYFYFKGKIVIDQTSQTTLFTVLTVCCVFGTLMLFSLLNQSRVRTPLPVEPANSGQEGKPLVDSASGLREEFGVGPTLSPLQSFYRSFQLLKTKEMLLLSVTIAYTGFELTFFSGVYGTCVGNTINLEDRKRQIGLVGMLIGAGEITGGLAFGIFGKKTNRYGRDPIVLLGFLIHLVTFYLIFLNIPDRAPIEETTGYSYLHYNLGVVGLCGFLLGLGDSSFNTQLYSCLGTLFSEDSASAFALFKFVQSVAAAIGFGYSIATPLKWQLLLLCIFGFAGTLAFFAVERMTSRQRREGYTIIKETS